MSIIAFLLPVKNEELNAILHDSGKLEQLALHDNERLIDLDKSWAGIVYVLTGKDIEEISDNDSNRLYRVIFSGQIVDEEQDLGYGPAHYLSSDEVRKLSIQLESIDIRLLRSNYNPEKMNHIYPQIWDESDSFEWLIEYFNVLKQTFSRAADHGMAIITFLG